MELREESYVPRARKFGDFSGPEGRSSNASDHFGRLSPSARVENREHGLRFVRDHRNLEAASVAGRVAHAVRRATIAKTRATASNRPSPRPLPGGEREKKSAHTRRQRDALR